MTKPVEKRESKGLEIAREWKEFWMNQHQNSVEDFNNYYRRSFLIDANMLHNLGDRIDNWHEQEMARLKAAYEDQYSYSTKLLNDPPMKMVRELTDQITTLQKQLSRAVEALEQAEKDLFKFNCEAPLSLTDEWMPYIDAREALADIERIGAER